MRLAVLAVAGLAVSSCKSPEAWMPLKVGDKWTYRVRTPHFEYVEDAKVVRRAPVGSQLGFVVESQLGQTHLAWSGTTLWATRVGHTVFLQPIPIFDAENDERSWKGAISVAGKTMTAEASLACGSEEVRVTGTAYKTRRAVLTLKAGTNTYECATWFARGIGIVKQEQRTNGTMAVGMERVRGS